MFRRLPRPLACALAVAGTLAAAPPAVAQTAPPDPERFQKVLIEDGGLGQPMRLAVAADKRVIYIQRAGTVHVWDPERQDSQLAGTLETTVIGETGLIGLTLAPDFATTGHLYLYRSLPGYLTAGGPDFLRTRVSRFTLGDDNVLDPASEVPVIDILNRWPGHVGGDLEMSPDGLLYITTGDNTNCCASFGFAPHDERPGRDVNDAQRTSANTNDLNGKLLRIRPRAEGGYTVPEGNLFTGAEGGGGKARPEIYAMGFRNLFSIGGIDPATGAPWIADYGPDAVLDGERGPRGFVRGMLVTEAANYGWPYCTANLVPYADWDYVNDRKRGLFDCAAPVNDSPNNTGLVNLPPIKAANLYYSYTSGEPWPMLYGGGLHALDRYAYDPANPSPTKFPEWFDGRFFFSEFTANVVGSLRFGADARTPEDVRLHFQNMQFGSPFDARFGPDGSLYMIEFGSNNFSSTKSTPAIYRIDYVAGNRVPLVRATADRDSGQAPLQVAFDASRTTDPDGDDLSFAWDFDNDGTTDATGPQVTHTFSAAGEYTTRVRVTDAQGGSAIANVRTVVGNTRPTVEFLSPADGGFHEFTAGPIRYKLRVTDPEDGSAVDCTHVRVEYALGHDRHQHPEVTSSPDANCEGTITPTTDESHASTAYLYHVLTATYTDAGSSPLTGEATVILHPRAYQAQHTQDSFGTVAARAIYNMSVSGAYLMYPHVNLAGVDRVNVEISGQTGSLGGNWTLRAGSPTGPVVARLENLPDTGTTYWGVGGDAKFVWLTDTVDDPGGVNDLYIVVDYPPGTSPGRVSLRGLEFVTAPSAVEAGVNAPDGTDGWHRTPPRVTVEPDAPLWLGQVSTDSGATWQDTGADGTVLITAEGTHTVRTRAVDKAGVSVAGPTLDVKVDTVAPTVSLQDPGVVLQGYTYAAAVECADATSGVADCTASPATLDTAQPGVKTLRATAVDRAGNTTTTEMTYRVLPATSVEGTVGGTVPATLALSLGAPASFGPFTPGLARVYTATTDATITSTAGDAALTVVDRSTTAPGRLVNGSFSLPQPLRVSAGGAPVPVSDVPAALRTWTAPVGAEAFPIAFEQAIGANDALRTGTYAKTVTFTLSTTSP